MNLENLAKANVINTHRESLLAAHAGVMEDLRRNYCGYLTDAQLQPARDALRAALDVEIKLASGRLEEL